MGGCGSRLRGPVDRRLMPPSPSPSRTKRNPGKDRESIEEDRRPKGPDCKHGGVGQMGGSGMTTGGFIRR
jgi:hypothetical protein